MTEIIRQKAEQGLTPVASRPLLVERLRSLQDAFQAMSRQGGLPADKAYFDELSGAA